MKVARFYRSSRSLTVHRIGKAGSGNGVLCVCVCVCVGVRLTHWTQNSRECEGTRIAQASKLYLQSVGCVCVRVFEEFFSRLFSHPNFAGLHCAPAGRCLESNVCDNKQRPEVRQEGGGGKSCLELHGIGKNPWKQTSQLPEMCCSAAN